MLAQFRESLNKDRLADFDALVSSVREASFGELKASDLRTALRLSLSEKLKTENESDRYAYGYVVEVFQSFVVTTEEFWDSEADRYQSGNFKRDYSVNGTAVTVGDRGIAVELSWVPVLASELPVAAASYLDCDSCYEAQTQETVQVLRTVERGLPTPEALACSARETHASEASGSMADATFSDENYVIEGIVPIVAGMSKNRKFYPASVLQRDVAVFNGLPVFYDHQDPDQPKPLKNIIGVLENARWDATAGVPRADLRYTKSSEAAIQDIRDKHTLLGGDRVGFSIDMSVKARVTQVEGMVAQSVEALIGGFDASTDVVFNPAAGGTFDKALETAQETKETGMTPEQLAALESMSADELRAARPDLFPATETQTAATDAAATAAASAATITPAAETVSRESINQMVREAAGRMVNETTFRTRVAEAKVSDRVRTAILREAEAVDFDPAKTGPIFEGWLNDAAAAQGGPKIIVPGISANGLRVNESVDMRYARLLGAAKNEDQVIDGQKIRRFTGLREAIFSFHPELMQMAAYNPRQFAREAIDKMHWGGGELSEALESRSREAIISTTFALSWADVMQKTLLAEVENPDLNTWRKIVSDIVPFADLTNTKKFIQLGDYPDIADVAEGAAYQYTTTPGEQKVEYKIGKKGTLEKYTWESALADDLSVLSRIPRKLGEAWAWTVYRFVFSLLTANSGDGATMDYDSLALYNAAHNNSTNTAFTVADLVVSEGKMRDQKDITQTGNPKPFKAKYLLYASETSLRQAIWEALVSAFKVNPLTTSGSQVNLPNYVREYFGLEPVEVYYPDNSTTRWELVADPRRVPTISVGFLNGMETPEIFVQDMDRVGTVFNNDVITYKLRGTIGADVMEHRAFSRGRK